MATSKKPVKKTVEVKAETKTAAAVKPVETKAPEVKPAAVKAEPAKAAAVKAEPAKVETKVEAKVETKKPVAKKPAAPKAAKPAVKAVEATYESIFKAVEAKAKKAKFADMFVATQITLKGAIENQPLYVKVEDKKAEVAAYEYNDASFYIDADAESFAAILNGKKTLVDAIVEGTVTINGDAAKAVVFVATMF